MYSFSESCGRLDWSPTQNDRAYWRKLRLDAKKARLARKRVLMRMTKAALVQLVDKLENAEWD